MNLGLREDVVLAGGILLDGDFCPIYVRPETGDVVYASEVDGANMLVEGVSITNPIELPNAEGVETMLEEGKLGEGILGIVYTTDKAVVIISESLAEERPLHKVFAPSGNIVEIDLNSEDPMEY